MQPHHLPTPLFVLALTSLLPTTATALTPPLPLHSMLNLTSHTHFHPHATNLTGHSIRNCVADPSWNPPTLLISPDCKNALLSLENEDEYRTPIPGQFVYNNGHSSAIFSKTDHDEKALLQLPKRYVSGQCVVAIVMMKTFEEAGIKVPGVPMGVWPESEEVRWREMVEGGRYVMDSCANGCGYATVGKRDGVAVVVWEVDSLWDRFVRGRSVGREGFATS